MKIHIQVEGLKALQDKLKTQADKLANLQEFWHIIGEYMKKRTIKECFDKEQAPDGTKWKPLSQSRVKQRMKRHKTGNMKILQDTGELRRSVKYRAFDKYLIIGSNLKYSRVHQFGGGKNNIPARPFLGVTEQDKQHIIKTFEAFINKHNVQ